MSSSASSSHTPTNFWPQITIMSASVGTLINGLQHINQSFFISVFLKCIKTCQIFLCSDSTRLSDCGGDVARPRVNGWMQTCNVKHLKWSKISRTFTVHLPSKWRLIGRIKLSSTVDSSLSRIWNSLKAPYCDKTHNHVNIMDRGWCLSLFYSVFLSEKCLWNLIVGKHSDHQASGPWQRQNLIPALSSLSVMNIPFM